MSMSRDLMRQSSVASLQDRLDTVENTLYTAAPMAPAAPHRQLANPSPLGLFGFAMVSVLSAAIKISSDPATRSSGLLPGTAFFLGATAQLIASLFQFLNNNVHSATTFGVFGLHWASRAFLLTFRSLSQLGFESDVPPGIDAVYYALLTVVTIILWVPSMRMNKVLQSTLMFVIFVFAFEVGAAFGSRVSEIISGVFAIIASSLALYMALLDLVNEAWKKPLLPLFPHKEHKHDYDSLDGIPYVPKRTFHKSAFGSVHL